MKRRTFLTNLAATATLPMMPLKALASAAPAAAAASMEQPYLWASFITRVHNNASPSMLQRLLKLDENMAKTVYKELIKNNVVTTPNAYGISQAVNPYPQPGMSFMKPTSAPAKPLETDGKSLKLNQSDDETPEIITEDQNDSPPVNQESAGSEDDTLYRDSSVPTDATEPTHPDPNRQA